MPRVLSRCPYYLTHPILVRSAFVVFLSPHFIIHSEAINPVALGLARAKQYALIQSPEYMKNVPTCMLGDKVMSVQIHGDASFTGQGIVMESLGLSMFRVRGEGVFLYD